MKIDATSNYGLYRKPIGGDMLPAKKASKNNTAAKTDVADFSRGNTSVTDKRMASLKASLQHDIASSSDPQRIAQLRAQVRSGEYRVSTEELIDAILQA